MCSIKMSKCLLAALLVVAFGVPLVTSFTECQDISDEYGLCYQYCIAGGCDMTCLKSDKYDSCQQICPGGNCNMTCNVPTKCDFICTGGNCQTVICKADTCEQSCTGGGCGLECHGNSCRQGCAGGSCKLQCPRDAGKCYQWCRNKDECAIEHV